MRNIIIFMALWKRPKLTRFVLSQLQKLKAEAEGEGLNLLFYLVGSEEAKSAALAKEIGANYVEAPNEPLHAKWNAAAALAKQHQRFDNADWALILGSDNLVNLAYLLQADAMIRMGAEFLQPDGCTFLDLPNNRASHIQGFQGGAGRVISRALLDRVDWKVWHENETFSIDHHQYRHLTEHLEDKARRNVLLPMRLSVPWQLLDIKSGFNVWPWTDFMPGRNPACQNVLVEPYLLDYFPEVEEYRKGFVQRMMEELQDG